MMMKFSVFHKAKVTQKTKTGNPDFLTPISIKLEWMCKA
jgi:hypothetical protein